MDLDHTVLPANSIMPAYLVSVHQMASSLIVVADIYFQLTTHLSTSQIRSAPQIRSYTPTLYSEHLAIWPTTSVLPTAVVLVHGQPQHDAGHTSYDDVTGRQSICRRGTACLEQPSSRHP